MSLCWLIEGLDTHAFKAARQVEALAQEILGMLATPVVLKGQDNPPPAAWGWCCSVAWPCPCPIQRSTPIGHVPGAKAEGRNTMPLF